MKTRLLDLLSLAVLCVILTLGLWPFHSPANDVAWLPNCNGLQFARYSTVIGSSPFSLASASASVEIWLQPRSTMDSATLLAFPSFSLRQSETDLELRTADKAVLYVNDVFRRSRPVLVTVTSGIHGTAVYIDGALARTAPRLRFFANGFTGRLVLGDSPGQPDNWSGRVLGLALYASELTPAQVLRHDAPAIARYSFNECAGRIVHNQVASAPNLYIPEKYMVLDKFFLEPFWQEFRMSRSTWRDILKNVVGFIPFGACSFACLSAHRLRRAALIAVLLGFLVSLTIEVLQAYLPTRDSGTTDLFTNTLGTYLGVLAWRAVAFRLHPPGVVE